MNHEIVTALYKFYNEGIISYLQLDCMLKQLDAGQQNAQQQNGVQQEAQQASTTVQQNQAAGQAAVQPARQKKPINVPRLTFTIIGITAAVLIGSAIVNFVAANWMTMSVALKMVFAAAIVLSACVIGFIAFRKDHFVWLEGGAVYSFAAAIAVSAIISQALQSQTDEAAFLTVLLPVAAGITIGFNSRIMYIITSMLFIACSVANDYRMWWLIAIWVIFHIVKSLIEKDKSPFFVLSIIAQSIILTFGFTHSFIKDPIIVASLLCVTAFLYDRIWIIFKKRQSDDYPDKNNAFRVIGIIIFFVTVGPVFGSGFDTSQPYWLVSLPMLASYLTVIMLSPKLSKSGIDIKIRNKEITFPVIGIVPLSITLGMVFAHIHPVAGALVSIIPVIVAFLFFGNYHSNNKYLLFGLALTIYLSALTIFLTEGAFMTRAVFGAVTGGVLLLLNWGVRKYGKFEK